MPLALGSGRVASSRYPEQSPPQWWLSRHAWWPRLESAELFPGSASVYFGSPIWWAWTLSRSKVDDVSRRACWRRSR